MTAIVSAIGSAKKIALTGFPGKSLGISKINGISRIIFRKIAKKIETFAFPSAIKVCWMAI